MDDVTRGSMIRITGEALRNLLGLPRWAKIIKVVHSERGDYIFNVLYFDRESYEIAEAQYWPVVKSYDLDDDGNIRERDILGEKEK